MSRFFFLTPAISHAPSNVQAHTKTKGPVAVGTTVFIAGGWKIVITGKSGLSENAYTAVSIDSNNNSSEEFVCSLLGKGNHKEIPACFFMDEHGIDVSQGTAHLWQIHINFRGDGRMDWCVTPKFWARRCGKKPRFRSKTGMASFHKWSSIPKSHEEASAFVADPASGAPASGAGASASGGAAAAAVSSAVSGASAAPNLIIFHVTYGEKSVSVKIKDTIRVYKITRAMQSYFKSREKLYLCVDGIPIDPKSRACNPKPLRITDGQIASICDGDELTVVPVYTIE